MSWYQSLSDMSAAAVHSVKGYFGGNQEEPDAHTDEEQERIISEIEFLTDRDREEQSRKSLVVAVCGIVSAGKTSLLKALLNIPPQNRTMEVSALSGTTKEPRAVLLRSSEEGHSNIILLDLPGLHEVYHNDDLDGNTRYQRFLKSMFRRGVIDCGIMVVTGAADSNQRKDYQELKRISQRVFVVRSKWDDTEHLSEQGRARILKQWRKALSMEPEEPIFTTTVRGYDPEVEDYGNVRTEGLEALRKEILKLMKTLGKQNALYVWVNEVFNDERLIMGAAVATVVLSIGRMAILAL
eukprot:Clim_evm22s148 gene=Clim_evmTU22s148